MSNAKKNENKEKVLINAPFPFSVAMTGKNLQRKLIINQNLKPVNPLQCGRQACPSGYSYSSGERYYWLLHFVISGKGALMNRSGRHPVRENEMFVIRPFESVTYTADVDEPWEYIWIGFTSETPVPPILECGDVIRAPYLKELFISAYENGYFENMDTHGAYEHYLCGVIWQIFGVLLHNTKREMTVTDTYIKPAITLMELYYFDLGLTVEELARRLHISKAHFGRVFKSETGISPKKYLNGIRMKKAEGFLTQKKESVSRTAKAVGFPDVFAFSRAFKRHFGCSPTEYISNAKAE